MIAYLDSSVPLRLILRQAGSAAVPTSLGTLDAIHLATALLWREKSGKSLAVATFATASRAFGFEVLGV